MTNTLINEINKDWKKYDNNQQATFLKSIGYRAVKGKLVDVCLGEAVAREFPHAGDAVSLVDVTAKQLNKIKKAVGFDNWSQKQVKNFDKEAGTNYSELLQGISCPTARNTMRSDIIWYSEYKNEALTVLEERIAKDKKTSSLSSLKKHTTAAIKKLEKEIADANETTEAEATEPEAEATEIVKPVSEEEYAQAMILMLKDAKKAGRDTKAILQMMGDMLKAEKLNK
jgi:hypothetical protein